MAKKKIVGDDDVIRPIDLPEEEDDKVLPIPTEEDELLDEELEDEEE